MRNGVLEMPSLIQEISFSGVYIRSYFIYKKGFKSSFFLSFPIKEWIFIARHEALKLL